MTIISRSLETIGGHSLSNSTGDNVSRSLETMGGNISTLEVAASGTSVDVTGALITIDVPDLDGALLTAREAGKNATVSLTSEGYSSTTLGTTARSFLCEFESASGSSPAVVVLRCAEPIYLDDTSITIDLDVGLFDDGTTSSAAISSEAVTNNSTLDYPKIMCQIAGIIDSSDDIWVEHSALSGIVTAEAVALGHFCDGQPAAAVKFELDDGVTTLSTTVTAMSRSTYNPELFYDTCVAAGLVASDPYATNSGGSGVFKTDFDTSSLNDGAITLTVTAYPVIGDADSTRVVTWDLWNDDGATLTPTELFVDSRASMEVSGVVGTPVEGHTMTGDTSGAIGIFRSISGTTVQFSTMNEVDFSATENVTFTTENLTNSGGGHPSKSDDYKVDPPFVASGASFTVTGSLAYNGDTANAGTEIAPKRHLWKDLPRGSTSEQNEIILMGDTTNKCYFSHGRQDSTSNAAATWTHIHPNTGLDKTDIYINGLVGANFEQIRVKRTRFTDCTIISRIPGKDTSETAIWLDDCVYTTPGGRIGQTETWPIPNYYQIKGAFYTNFHMDGVACSGMDQATLARNVIVNQVNADCTRECELIMEYHGTDNNSPDLNAHQDGIQFASLVQSNHIYYNLAYTDLISGQLFLSDNLFGAVLCNILSMTANGLPSDPATSQIGDGGSAHNVIDAMFCHLSFVNSRLGYNEGIVGAVDRNTFIKYIVTEDFTGEMDEIPFIMDHNHLIDSTIDRLNITSEVEGNPWVDGVGSHEDDNASTRDYRPLSATLKNRVPSGERYVPFDLFGTAVANDGTAAIGALQVTGAVAPVSGSTLIRATVIRTSIITSTIVVDDVID